MLDNLASIEDLNHEDEFDGEAPMDCAYIYNHSPIKNEIIDTMRKHGGKARICDEDIYGDL